MVFTDPSAQQTFSEFAPSHSHVIDFTHRRVRGSNSGHRALNPHDTSWPLAYINYLHRHTDRCCHLEVGSIFRSLITTIHFNWRVWFKRLICPCPADWTCFVFDRMPTPLCYQTPHAWLSIRDVLSTHCSPGDGIAISEQCGLHNRGDISEAPTHC